MLPRKIQKNGFVIKTAYFWTDAKEIPSTVNLCNLFWRFLAMFFLGVPFSVLGIAILVAIIIVIASIWNFFIGKRVTQIFSEKSTGFFELTDFWLPKVAGKRVWPIVPMALIALLWGTSYVPEGIRVISTFLKEESAQIYMVAWVFGVAFICCLVFFAIRAFLKTEAWEMTKGFLDAKKEKVCPIIEVTE